MSAGWGRNSFAGRKAECPVVAEEERMESPEKTEAPVLEEKTPSSNGSTSPSVPSSSSTQDTLPTESQQPSSSSPSPPSSPPSTSPSSTSPSVAKKDDKKKKKDSPTGEKKVLDRRQTFRRVADFLSIGKKEKSRSLDSNTQKTQPKKTEQDRGSLDSAKKKSDANGKTSNGDHCNDNKENKFQRWFSNTYTNIRSSFVKEDEHNKEEETVAVEVSWPKSNPQSSSPQTASSTLSSPSSTSFASPMQPRKTSSSSSCDLIVTIVGDTGVGKTTFLNKLMNIEEEATPTKAERTVLVPFEMEETSYSIEFRDVPMINRSISFYKNTHESQAFICMYSISSSGSLLEMQHLIKEIQRNRKTDNKPMVMIVIGNKCDKTRAIATYKVSEMCEKMECGFLETSAKMGTNVQETIKTLLKHAIGLNIIKNSQKD